MKNPLPHIRNVALVGGTHGNELTGIHLLRRWERNPEEVNRSSFNSRLFMGNPEAFRAGRRYVETDLNRCFRRDLLTRADPATIEARRAAELNEAIGPKDAAKHDLVIDLHTTTSCAGTMLVLLDEDAFHLHLAAYIGLHDPATRVCIIPPQSGDQPYLHSLCPLGLAVEIGPIPQGVLRRDIYAHMHRAVMHALDFVDRWNEGRLPPLQEAVDVFRIRESVPCPVEGDYLGGMVHEAVQDRDYEPLHPGDPLFRTLSGDILPYTGSDTVYPLFINEAAYVEKGIAMFLADRESVRVPPGRRI